MDTGKLGASFLLLAPEDPAAVALLPAARPSEESSLLLGLLEQQQRLTAVERFARQHEGGRLPDQAKYYRDLIPLDLPRAGQQYGFEVNLDLCTGCKACVTACHSLNGLDEDEVWRTVGLLHGGTSEEPVQQTVTTTCHHCIDPACLSGCPVKAYEKNALTGIVKHLDDQCIGCQYCIFMCPYDAPKYSKSRGIVRKCDMCSDRLAVGEAPACVQSCPNQAIKITVVDQAQSIAAAEANSFLPGAPEPGVTLPTTAYLTQKPVPRNLQPADFYKVNPEHSHLPLVVMLVLTQLSVGAFCVNLLADQLRPWRSSGMETALFAFALGAFALGASVFHLGRPQYAFRSLLGLRTSWMSREVLSFGLFALFSTAQALSFSGPVAALLPAAALQGVRTKLGYAVAASGILGVACSAMVYAATRRIQWRGSITGFKFALTTIILGCATVIAVSSCSARWGAGEGSFDLARDLQLLVAAAVVLKLLSEAAVFLHLRDRKHTMLKVTAILMTQALKTATRWRFLCGAIGGLLLPLCAALVFGPQQLPQAVAAAFSIGALLFLVAGELLERYLFFIATKSPKMPGGIAG